jgi:serpin B
VAIGITSAPLPEEPLMVKVDHPFVLMIRERATGSVLFVGRVVAP